MKAKLTLKAMCMFLALTMILPAVLIPLPVRAEDDFSAYEFDPDTTYTISWYVNEPNGPTPDDADIKLILEERFNVKFEMVYVDRANRDEILATRIASGEFPDVMTASDPALAQEYYDQGLTAEIPIELIEHFMPTIAACIRSVGEQEGIDPYVYTSANGVNIGIPNFNYAGQYEYTSLFRRDWLDALGISKTPETLEELNEAFYALRDHKQDIIDAGLTNQTADNIYGLSSGRIKEPFASIYGAFGSLPYNWELNEDGETVQYGAIQPGMKEALAQLAQWYADGILNPEFITGENRGDHWSISHDFVEGRILYTNNGPFYQDMPAGISAGSPKGGKMYKAYVAAGNDPASYEVGSAPVGPHGDSGSVMWGVANGGSIVLSASLANDKPKLGRVLSMIEEMCTSPEYYELLYYGVEGKHFVREEDGTYTILIPDDELIESYGIGIVFVAWGEALGLCVADDPAYYAYGDTVARNGTRTYKDVLLGMSMPSSDIYWDELEKLRVQTYNDIIQGIKPVDAFDDFVDEWLASGGQIITDEANEWFRSAQGK
ncbi:MAG: hypothetical protein ACI4MK_01060 [Aristaeellaceae bacterium]